MSEDTLETYAIEHARAEQLEVNCRWLVDVIDAIHMNLCPGQYGTWQEKAKQAVEAAKEINKGRFKKQEKKVKKRTKKFITEIEEAHTRAGKSKLIFKQGSIK